MMIEWMKIELEEAPANLTIAQNWAMASANKSLCDDMYKVGDEVVLSTHNLHVNKHLPFKLWDYCIGLY